MCVYLVVPSHIINTWLRTLGSGASAPNASSSSSRLQLQGNLLTLSIDQSGIILVLIVDISLVIVAKHAHKRGGAHHIHHSRHPLLPASPSSVSVWSAPSSASTVFFRTALLPLPHLASRATDAKKTNHSAL